MSMMYLAPANLGKMSLRIGPLWIDLNKNEFPSWSLASIEEELLNKSDMLNLFCPKLYQLISELVNTT